jgi:hypothetical protein
MLEDTPGFYMQISLFARRMTSTPPVLAAVASNTSMTTANLMISSEQLCYSIAQNYDLLCIDMWWQCRCTNMC